MDFHCIPHSTSLVTLPFLSKRLQVLLTFVKRVELQFQKRLIPKIVMAKTRPFLLTFVIVSVLGLIPLIVWRSIHSTFIGVAAYNVFWCLILLILIVNSSIFGIRLILKLRREIQNQVITGFLKRVNNTVFRQLLNFDTFFQITLYILTFDAILLCLIGTSVTFVVTAADTEKWKYVILVWLTQAEECIAVLVSLLYCSKKKPKAEDESSSSVGRTSELSTVQDTQE